jgi:hypothetical protein
VRCLARGGRHGVSIRRGCGEPTNAGLPGRPRSPPAEWVRL